jgi:hypothetical protein
MSHWTGHAVARIIEHGGYFVRRTGRGHRRFFLKGVYLDLPDEHEGEDSRLKKNIEAQIKRALQGIPRMPRRRE